MYITITNDTDTASICISCNDTAEDIKESALRILGGAADLEDIEDIETAYDAAGIRVCGADLEGLERLIDGPPTIESALEWIELLADYGFAALEIALTEITGTTDNPDDVRDVLENLINTGAEKMEDVAFDYIESCYGRRDLGPLSDYIDYKALGRDMEIEGQYYHGSDGCIYEFIG